MIDQKDLINLFERYLSGNCSTDEVKTLFGLFNDPSNEKSLRKLVKHALKSDEIDPSAQNRVDHITKQAEENILEVIRSEPATKKTIPLKLKNILVAAATLLLICTLGIKFFIVNQDANKDDLELIHEFGGDIAPGGNRATLTIGDGKKITLSEEKSGIITAGDSLQYNDGSTFALKQAQVKKFILSTPTGGQYSVVLPDGTKVWLNAESSLTYPGRFDGHERRVELIGEAYFEVQHHESPFIVSSKQQEIQVIGTHFNVNAYKNQAFTTTTLVNGSVEIISRESQVSSRLLPGKQSIVKNGEITIEKVDVTPYIGWRDGLFSFRETEIHEVMDQLSRWYDVEIVYETSIPPTHFFGDIKRSETLASVLNILKQSGVNFRIESNDSKNILIILP